MSIQLGIPDAEGMPAVLTALREWQGDDATFQLHPGDIGWFERFGAGETRAAIRSWARDGRILAVGLLDGPDLLRLTVAPTAAADEDLARAIARDLDDPDRGVLPAGAAYLESPTGIRLRDLLADADWQPDEAWTPLRRDLREPVEYPGLRVELVDPASAAIRVEVQRASFETSKFTIEAWNAMASGAAFGDARDLIGYDAADNAVAAITVWSAGSGRPGLVEPMGVHRDHRRHGYGTAITLAGAAALRDLGSSCALVCTRSSNGKGIATYEAAGFERLPQRFDLARGAHAPS